MYSLQRKEDAFNKCYDIMADDGSDDLLSREEFLTLTDGEDCFAITYDDETVGCVWFQRGQMIHLAVEKEHRGKWAYNLWPDIMAYIEETYETIYAPVRKTNKETISLMLRAGFKFLKQDHTHTWWHL